MGAGAVPVTVSEIPVDFHDEGAGTAGLTWGQLRIWRMARQTGRTMNLVSKESLPEGTPVEEIVGLTRFIMSRHPALRTRLSFTGEDPCQVVAGAGEVPLQIVDIDDGDDPAAVA